MLEFSLSIGCQLRSTFTTKVLLVNNGAENIIKMFCGSEPVSKKRSVVNCGSIVLVTEFERKASTMGLN